MTHPQPGDRVASANRPYLEGTVLRINAGVEGDCFVRWDIGSILAEDVRNLTEPLEVETHTVQVVLAFDINPGDGDPAEWDWRTLIDHHSPVIVHDVWDEAAKIVTESVPAVTPPPWGDGYEFA